MKNLFLKYYIHFQISFIILFPNIIWAQSGDAKSLEIGNKWVYYVYGEITPYYEFKEIINDTIIDNLAYAIITINRSGWPTEYLYERADSNNVFVYSPHDSLEYLEINFNLNEGDIVTLYPFNQLWLVIAKYFTELWNEPHITIWLETADFIWSHIWHIKGLGMLQQDIWGTPTPNYTYELVAANIEGKIFGDTTLVDIEYQENDRPIDFNVHQNYPNPFNPKTTIVIDLPTSGNVNVKIYDLLGRLVEENDNFYNSAGRFEIIFNGTNYSTGVYLYIVEFEHKIQLKKMLLLK